MAGCICPPKRQRHALPQACIPGLLMTPVSSMLEACNAGHANPEPLALRWMRGIQPRALREVIFGIGINQLSDWCEERVPATDPLRKAFFGTRARRAL